MVSVWNVQIEVIPEIRKTFMWISKDGERTETETFEAKTKKFLTSDNFSGDTSVHPKKPTEWKGDPNICQQSRPKPKLLGGQRGSG